jgi:serine/threonine protein kinase
MLSYTSFAHGPNFTIISPLADLDLHTFFQGIYKDFQARSHNFTPAHLLYGASCLAGALKFLHEGLRPRGIAGKIFCAHLDLKPENILVVWKGKDEPAGRWLVHDFGTSKIKETSFARTLAPGDFLRQFSLTQPQRAPGPFQAPEVQRSNERAVGRESDIWSLGCILAVVLAFARGGPPLVKSLAESTTHGECADDYFYMKRDNRIILKGEVVRQLESLNTGSRDDAWIKETLFLIYNTLIEKPSSRPSAEKVQRTLENIWNRQIDSLQNVCPWVPKELSCESPRTARPMERLRIPESPAEPVERLRIPESPAEPVERTRIPESPADIRRGVVETPRRREDIESGLEVVPSSQLPSPLTPSTVQFPPSFRDSSGTEGRRASGQPTSRSSSVSAMRLSLTDDRTFMKLEVPKDTFKSVMCPSACHVTFLSKKRATIVRLGNEGTWMPNPKPPKIETDARTRSIPCPDNWEWDFASIAGAYLILRSKKPGAKERKVGKCQFVSTSLIVVLGLPI